MSITVQSFAPAPQQPQSFNPAIADHLRAQSNAFIAVDAEPSSELDTAAQLSHYLTIYIDLLDALNNQDIPKMKRQLSHFKRLLTSQVADSYRHLLRIQKRGGSQAAASDCASQFHHDRVVIGGQLLPLLNRHVNDPSMAGLLDDLTDVGEVLMAT